jgi:hypothetical protein
LAHTDDVTITNWASYSTFVIFATLDSNGNPQYHALDATDGSVVKTDSDAGAVVLNPSSTGSIYEIQNLKFSGNKANNTSGSAIVAQNAHEVGLHHVEMRSFAEDGIRFEEANKAEWNKFVNCWALDNDRNGIRLDVTSGGQTVQELDLIGCTLSGGDPGTVDTGKPGLNVASGTVQNLNIFGGTLKGSDVVDLDDITYCNLVGVQGRDLKGNWAVRVGEGINNVRQLNIGFCNFNSDSVDDFIRLGLNLRHTIVTNNMLRGADNTAIVNNAAGNTRTRNNNPYTTENSGAATVSNGSTSTSVSHGLAETPNAQGIHATPTDDLGTASYFWIDTAGSTSFTINLDADPGQDVSFGWEAKAPSAINDV